MTTAISQHSEMALGHGSCYTCEEAAVRTSAMLQQCRHDNNSCPRMREAIKHEKIRQWETWRRHQGSAACAERVAVPAAGCADRYIGHADVFSDVTGGNMPESRHQQIVATALDGFLMADVMGNLREANAAYARISGYSPEELAHMHFSQLEAGKQSHEEIQARIATIVGQGGDRYETIHRHKDGHEIDIEVTATFLPESQLLSIFCRDITGRKHAENALRQAAVAFETRNGIVITDPCANIIRVNRAFPDITGYSPEEVVGNPPSMLTADRHGRDFYSGMRQHLLRTGFWAGEFLGKHKNGHTYRTWLSISAIKNERQETTHYVGVFSDLAAHGNANEQTPNLAFYDALTGLPNRSLFLDRFRSALPASARQDNHGAVLFIDLDHFKTLNDTHGHTHGDHLLKEVATRIKSCVRATDTVARMGGDEFVVLIEGISENQDDASRKAGFVAEKIRGTLAQSYNIGEREHYSSPSIGVCLFHGNEQPTDVLLQHADIAMYQAKDSGRNAVRFFDPAMQHKVAAHAALADDLHHALARQQLHLYYQVQVDKSRLAQGAEVLLRWVYPQHGFISPAEFIPLAESNGLILPIGQWVMDSACAQLKAWQKDPEMRDLQLAVNVSAKQFHQPGFAENVVATVERHGINPLLLKLELTESIVLDNIDDTILKMRQLKDHGVKLSLDDFGTGYSSLSYLKRLPLDQLKIDQSFVRNLAEDKGDAVMIQAIVDLGMNFELDVIAEGVEGDAQFDLLQRYGCTSFQGYLFSKPVPVEQFEQLLLPDNCRYTQGVLPC